MEILIDLFSDYTLRTVALGTAVLGIVSGALGTYAVLRRQSLLGDAMSHAALPGVVLAFLITGSRDPLVLITGAGVAGIIGTLFMLAITRYTRIREDSALGIILSVFFGIGLVLLQVLERLNVPNRAGLNVFLFGQAATLLTRDVIMMSIIGLIVLAVVFLFWKEFKLLSFDKEFGASIGFNMVWLDILLISLLVLAIVIGLQAVGVVLMSAMIVAPAAAARQWTDSLSVMVLLSSIFGAISGISGALISSIGSNLSTGPVVVLVVSGIVLFSILFASRRGVVWAWYNRLRRQRLLILESVLNNMLKLAEQHDDLTHPHALAVLETMVQGQGGVRNTLSELVKRGWVSQVDQTHYALTAAGIEEAQTFLVDQDNLVK